LDKKVELNRVITSMDQTGIKATENGLPLSLTYDLNELESPRRRDSNSRLPAADWNAVERHGQVGSWNP
jgi:hypothetical protein